MGMTHAAASHAITSGIQFNALTAILDASFTVKLVILILIGMSAVCWAIIFTKKRQIDLLRASNKPFLDMFGSSSSLDDIFTKSEKHPDSSIARIFRSGYMELRKMAESGLAKGDKTRVPALSGLDNLERSLRKASDLESARLTSRLNFLATCGSTGPFIGLFGTVWGIMEAFHRIGATNMASLAIVAPGVSEALITTAIGLVVAIPATIAFNHFMTIVQHEEVELNSFSSDFLNIAKRNFFKE